MYGAILGDIVGSLYEFDPIETTDFPLFIYDPEAKDDAGKPIRIVRRMGTNLGDLIADAFKNKTGAECSFINGGGIRVNIEKGDITLSEVIDVLPFGNILCSSLHIFLDHPTPF